MPVSICSTTHPPLIFETILHSIISLFSNFFTNTSHPLIFFALEIDTTASPHLSSILSKKTSIVSFGFA